jgi:hypothetical protein
MPKSKQQKILDAIEQHKNDRIISFLNNGLSVNFKDNEGKTLLMQAAAHDNVEILWELLEHGAKIDAQDKWGYSALMVACQHGHLYSVAQLLRAGADVYLKNKQGQTAMDLARSMLRFADFWASGEESGEDNDEEASEEGYIEDCKKIVMLLNGLTYHFLDDMIPHDLYYIVCQFA